MKVEGSNITINDSVYNKMSIIPKGACEQDSTTGKNKFPLQDTETKNGVTFTRNSDGTFNISTGSGTATANTQFLIIENISLPSGTYTLSKNKGGRDLRCYIQDYNGSSYLSNMMIIGSSTYENEITATITPAGNTTRFTIQVLSGVSIDLQNVEVQLESGSSKTSFEKYTNGASPNPDYPQDIRVVTGDNSIVVSNSTNIFNNKEYANANTSYFDYSDTNGLTIKQADNREIRDTNITINVTAGDVLYIKCNNNVSLTIVEYTSSDNYKTQVTKTNGESFTVASNVIKIRIKIAITSGTYPQNIGFIYLSSKLYEEQTYTLHLGSNYLAGIGTYKDEIVGKTDEWKIVRNMAKNRVQPSQHSGSGNVLEEHGFRSSQRLPEPPSSFNVLLCTHLGRANNYNEVVNINNNTPNLIGYGATGQILCNISGYTTSRQYLDFFDNNNVTIYSPLKTPVEIPITDTTLITDLNNMYQALSYDETTNITITSDSNNAQMIAEVTYTSESDMCEKLLFIFNKMKDKLYHIIRSL